MDFTRQADGSRDGELELVDLEALHHLRHPRQAMVVAPV
jgi:hypothetical protein